MRRNTYREFTDNPPLSYPNLLGRNKLRGGSEYIDDAIAECGGLRSLAAELRESLDEMDKNRRSGKGFDTSLPNRIRRRIDETLHRLDTAMAAMGASNDRP